MTQVLSFDTVYQPIQLLGVYISIELIAFQGIRRPHNENDENWTPATISVVTKSGFRGEIADSGLQYFSCISNKESNFFF